MTDKCSYCGAELPVQTDKETRCPVCGEAPPSQTVDDYASDTKSQTAAESGGPDFSQPPEAEPGLAYSQPSAPPLPEPSAHQNAGGQTQPGPTEHTPAWELEGGFWLQKLWRTIWQVLLHPGLTFAAPGRIQIGRPLIFALIIAVASNLVSDLFALLMTDEDLSGVVVLIKLLGSPFGSAIGTTLGLFLFGGIFHVFLMMFKAAKGGYITTFRVLSYASSIQIFIVAVSLPIELELWWLLGVTGSVFMVWQVVVMVCGLAAAHGTTYGRVIGAMLLWFAAFLVIVFIMVFIIILTVDFAP